MGYDRVRFDSSLGEVARLIQTIRSPFHLADKPLRRTVNEQGKEWEWLTWQGLSDFMPLVGWWVVGHRGNDYLD